MERCVTHSTHSNFIPFSSSTAKLPKWPIKSSAEQSRFRKSELRKLYSVSCNGDDKFMYTYQIMSMTSKRWSNLSKFMDLICENVLLRAKLPVYESKTFNVKLLWIWIRFRFIFIWLLWCTFASVSIVPKYNIHTMFLLVLIHIDVLSQFLVNYFCEDKHME